MQNRREFLRATSAAIGAAALSPILRAETKPSRIPIAFSTLGCPTWDWEKILSFAHDHGFSAIELRGLQGSMDLPSSSIFSADRIEQTKKDIHAAGLKIACVSSSANLYSEDPAKREQQLADARRFIDLA